MKSRTLILCNIALLLLLLTGASQPGLAQAGTAAKPYPKIVNIINFIRLLEPREAAITEDVLYQTVVQQVALMKQYKLGGTFLLQYDALMDSRYQQFLKNLPRDSFEIGGWWEIPQPMAEKAGLKWRGRYPWDWHADVGFSTGYSPQEREKLADVYMNDFKKIFGYYPKSVGSWFIDAHTLNYLYTKYKIVASSNCKDQLGTDGYTLWGGYWNQAYYPSKLNSYMPAQSESMQTPVPIFRMLGSDPVRQYDAYGHGNGQAVITLEPVYKFGGGDEDWVNWYFKEFVDGKAIEYAYVQAGQENSFTWEAMAKGLELQFPLIARLRDEKKLQVETLAASGQWFRDHYKLTPATSVTVSHDLDSSNKKTAWFNSRFFRTNLLWENGTLRIRDIQLFNENFPSVYTTQKATSNECSFFALPFVDGFRWGTKDQIAGLQLKTIVDGKEILLEGTDPVFDDSKKGKLLITWPLKTYKGTLHIEMDERSLAISTSGDASINWFLDLSTAPSASLPFTNTSASKIECVFDKMKYAVNATSGSFSKPANGTVFRITPVKNTLVLNFSGTK